MGDDSANVPERPVEREFAENGYPLQVAFFQSAFFGNDADGDRKVESRSGLPNFGRSQIDRDAFLRKGKSRISNGGPNPFAAFLDRRIAESDD